MKQRTLLLAILGAVTVGAQQLKQPIDAPPLDLRDTKGTQWTSKTLKDGRVYLVDFWATWCVSCREMEPIFASIVNERKDQKFALLSISIDTDGKKLRDFLKAKPMANPVLVDAAGTAWKTWDVKNVPTTYLVKDGKILAKWVGPTSKANLDKAISAALGK